MDVLSSNNNYIVIIWILGEIGGGRLPFYTLCSILGPQSLNFSGKLPLRKPEAVAMVSGLWRSGARALHVARFDALGQSLRETQRPNIPEVNDLTENDWRTEVFGGEAALGHDEHT
jgi:hypothetical protein